MFVSFFPKPKLFFWSTVLWTIVTMLLWYNAGNSMATALGLLPAPEDLSKGASVFSSRGPLSGFIFIF
jgi:peptide/bleomycin uptake transporter